MIHRRKFLQITAATASTLMFQDALGFMKEKKKTLGVQLFTLPKMVSQDFKGTLKLISDTGFREVEFFGPYSFSAPETIEQWKGIATQLGITQNAFYGYSLKDVKKILDDLDLKSHSAHLDLGTMRNNLNPAMESLATLGIKYAAVPALTNPEDRKTLDHFRRLADEFNAIGKQMSAHGITFVYHNHGYEHWMADGQTPMEVLLKNTDPNFVAFEMDIFWLTAGGADPQDFLKRYPRRFKLMHIKDASEPIRFSGDGGTPDQWLALFPKMADPGSGVFDIKGILSEAVKSGTEHFFLERDLAPDPAVTLKNSYSYLSKV